MVPKVVGSNPIFHPEKLQVADIQELGVSFFSPAPKIGAVCARFELKHLRPLEDMYPFKKARLNDCDGNLSARWYIEFYAWDVQSKKLLRKRFYEVNNYSSEKERRTYANRIIQQLNTLLKEGFHFDVNKLPPEAESKQTNSYSLYDAINYALEVKKPSLRTASYPSYKSTVKIFLAWAAEYRISDADVALFDKLRAIYYNDHLMVKCSYAAKTVNGHISFIKSLFQVMVEREIILNNPFKNLKKHKEAESRKNLAFTPKQMAAIKKIVEEKDPSLWLFIRFIYYCYLRPNEVRQLKHSYFQMEKSQIFVPGHISKNGKEGYVSIPETFKKELIKSKEFKSEQEYVFQGRNSKNPPSKNVMGYRYHKMIKDLKLNTDYTLYSWKHSGVVAAYNAGVDIKTIQNQCRHHSLEQTDIYLKSLGLGVSKAMNKIPNL